MNNSSLYKILEKLSLSEIRKFQKFVESPYYNTSSATTALCKEIIKHHPHYNNLSPKDLFCKIYNGRAFNNTLYKKLISNLIRLCEKFLISENKIFEEYSLLNALRQKKLYNLFRLRVNKLRQKYEEVIADEDFMLNRSFIESEKAFYYYETDNYINYEYSKNMVFIFDTLYYFHRLAQVYIRKKNVNLLDNIDIYFLPGAIFECIDINKLISLLSNSKQPGNEMLVHYISLLKLNSEKNTRLYKEVKKYTFDYSQRHRSPVLYLGYIYLLDFISTQIDSGNKEFVFERHEVYKRMEQDYYSSGLAHITLIQFRNFFNSGIKTGDIKFTNYIMENYIDELEAKGNPGLRRYFEAMLLFVNKNFTESLKVISKFKSGGFLLDDNILVPDIRSLSLQLYFELGYYEEAINFMDSFKKFLKSKKKLNTNIKKLHENFLFVFKNLVDKKYKGKEINIPAIKHFLNKENCYEKNWLKEKLNEIL